MNAPQASEPESKQCPNCGTSYRKSFSYCPGCGQKNVASKIKFRELLREFANSLFNIDARIVVTLRDLWKPAALTTAYFQGHRKKYIHPIRLFLFSLLFLLFGFSFFFDNMEGLNTEGYYDQIQHSEAQKRILKTIDSVYRVHLRNHPPSTQNTLDSFYLDVLHRGDYLADSIRTVPDSISGYLETDSSGLSFGSINVEFSISHRDLAYLSTEEILERYGTGAFWHDLFVEQLAKAFKNSRGLLFYLLGSITWVYLLLMPAIALFMALLYIRSERYYLEHLVYSIHVQTINSLLFGLSLFISYGFQTDTYLIMLFLVYIYFVLALKWYYKQSWIKTLLKVFLISNFYLFALIILALVVIMFRFLLF